MIGKIFEIKRFAVHDGDGIRTTVFFKGCPLKCIWCHNPEGISYKPQLAYYRDKCVRCGECARVCETKAHKIVGDEHIYDRKLCVACGKCADVCLGNALYFYGKEVDVDELIGELLKDKSFYDNSGGGVTLSGGECLMQADFCVELLKKLKENGVSTAVDTCGYVLRTSIDKVLSFTDIFLYDIKAIDENVHIKCTGHANKLILDNLKHIDKCGKKIEIRIPFVPEYNDVEIEEIAKFISGLNNVGKVRILPYHNYAGSKYSSLEMENTMPKIVPANDNMTIARERFILKLNRKDIIVE